jgi:putative tryptophan/tyrosine transport system substrate-binding protein
MRRRDFIARIAGLATAWPLVARAQQPDRVRRIGALMGFAENDPEGMLWLSSFTRAFRELGWIDGQNVKMDVRWDATNSGPARRFAKELVGLQPDAILAHGTPLTAALQRETRTIPIVFGAVSDPVGEGFVESLARPGGNITGFIFTEGEMGGKWLELLKEIAPSVKRATAIFNPDTAPGRGSYYLPSFEAAARSLKVESFTALVHTDVEIETAISALGREPGGGLVVIGDSFLVAHRRSIVSTAAKNNVPAVYFHASFARDGGLFSYGPDNADLFRRAATYVDRILRGGKPSELPVQVPTKFESAINLKTAKALGLNVPLHLQQLADEVIE